MLQMMQIWMMVIIVEPQAKHLRGLELEKGVGASELVGRMEQAGAHPLHHSVIGGLVASSFPSSYPLFLGYLPSGKVYDNSISAVKQRHIEEVCKGELDSETVGRVLQWGADLVKYYRSLEPGILVTVSGHLRLSI